MNETRTSEFYTEILRRLSLVRKKEQRHALLNGILAAFLILISVLLSAVILESIFSFGIFGRKVIFFAGLLITAAAAVRFILPPFLYIAGVLRPADNHTIASRVGSHFPLINDRLLDALQIYEQKGALRQHYSLSLIDASFADLFEQIRGLDFAEAVSGAKLRKTGKITLYASCIVLLFLIIFPSGFFGSLYRIANFNRSFADPPSLQFFVEPGNSEVVRGENVSFLFRTKGIPVKDLSFMTRHRGQIGFSRQQLLPGADGIFKTEIRDIKATTEYYASADEFKSERYTINVLDRPLIRSLRLRVKPPAYTRIPPRTLDENIGDINAYPGSKVEFQILSSKELSAAFIVFADSTTLPMSQSGSGAAGLLTVTKNTTYHFLLKDRNGLSNIDPVEYGIRVFPDEHPTAEILSPGRNVDLNEKMDLNLLIRTRDDFGFSSLRIAYRLISSRFEKPAEEFSSVPVPLSSRKRNQEDTWYRWDLSAMSLVPEDVLAYYAEVFDNDEVNGPKPGRSGVFLLRLPSLEEVFADVNREHEQTLESMQNIAQEAMQLKEEIDAMHRDMKKNREKPDWQQQKKGEETVRRYEALKTRIEQAAEKMNEMLGKMEENRLLSPETMEKYEQFRQLMEKLNSPELREALKKLQESMKQISPEQMKSAMEKLKFSEEQFRQSLERTIELLKRIHIEQKLDELIKRTEKLKEEQETIKENSSKTPPSDQQKLDDLAKQQEDLKKQMESLEKETAGLKDKMEEFPKEMPVDEMKKASEKLEKNQVCRKMEESAKQIESGEIESARQSQNQIGENLDEFRQDLEKAQKSLRDRQMKEIVNGLRRQLENILELSRREESLKEETKVLNPNSQLFTGYAGKQNEVMSDLGSIANAMGELGRKTFAVSSEMGKELGNALRQMEESMQQIEYRNPSGASQKQGEAMGSLNRTAMLMQGALNSMMQGGQGSMGMAGLMSQLQQAAGAQDGINKGTQETAGMVQGESGAFTPQQQAAYQRLAGQQGALKKSMEELAREAKDAGDYSRLLGDLDKIAKEMSEVQTDLEQGNVNPNTLNKQERILSRLLESTRSMRERDYEKRRRAETGRDIKRVSPADIDLSTIEGKNRLREELLKVLEGKYTKDYEELIKKYFEQLEKEKIDQ